MYNPQRIKGGLFISFEGPDCSGKSTQSKKLAKVLRERGYEVFETREPGGTRIGEEVRHIVKHVTGDDAVCDESELLLFCASRAQLVKKILLPFLQKGGIVVCDRFADSTTAYQGYGRGFDLDLIANLHQVATSGRWPDVTFLLDLDIAAAVSRGQMRLADLFTKDRIEEESLLFHEKVRQGYLSIAGNEPQRITILNAEEDREVLHNLIMEYVNDAITRLC